MHTCTINLQLKSAEMRHKNGIPVDLIHEDCNGMMRFVSYNLAQLLGDAVSTHKDRLMHEAYCGTCSPQRSAALCIIRRANVTASGLTVKSVCTGLVWWKR